MRINDVVEITHANLLNEPEISSFANITTELKNVVRGSLFIANDNDKIKEAIEQGAYGVIFEDGDLKIIDQECAWIKVDSLQDAITRLIRYKLLSNNISVLYLKNIEFEIAKEILTDPRVEFLQGDYADFLECIQKQGVQKIITKNPKFLELPLEYLEGIIPSNEPFKIISCTLFDSKIYFDSKRYIISLPSIFLGYLASVMTLFMNEEICFSLAHFEGISYLKPIFINQKSFICPYGQSGRVLLAEEQVERFKYYTNYLIENAKWAKVCFFVPENKQDLFPQAIIYKNLDSLLKNLEQYAFNFALILGVKSADLVCNLPQLQEEISLFDN